jgi:septation ring formation regulator EzrA
MTATDPILAALHEQVECYRRLAKLAEIQHDHVQQGRTELLLEVLARRQEVLEQVARCETTIGPAKRQWPQYVAKLESGTRAEADTLLAETRRLLEEITTADRNDALVLQQRKLSLGNEIGRANTARQVNRSYAAAAYGSRGSGRMDLQQ